MEYWKLLRGVGYVCLAVIATFFVSQWLSLGAFNLTVPEIIAHGVAMTIVAYVIYLAIAFGLQFTLRFKNFGWFLFMTMAMAAGTIAMSIFSAAYPANFTLSPLSAAAHIFVMMSVMWSVLGVFGQMKKGIKFWPEW